MTRDVLADVRAARPVSQVRFWERVAARRREWHTQDPDDGMETWRADDRAAWLGRLEDIVELVRESVEGALPADGQPALDPLEALVDVAAVACAWHDRMT